MPKTKPFIVGRETVEKVRCKFVKPDGTQCRHYALADGLFCRYHEIDSYRKHAIEKRKKTEEMNSSGVLMVGSGRYAASLKGRLLDLYQAALRDEVMLELRDEIALIDSRTKLLLEEIDTYQTSVSAAEISKMAERGLELMDSGDYDAATGVFNDLLEQSEKTAKTASAWDKLADVLAQRRVFVESERRYQLDAKRMIPIEKVIMLMARVAESVRAHVKDELAIRSVAADIERLLNGDTSIVGGAPAGKDLQPEADDGSGFEGPVVEVVGSQVS